MSLLQISIHLLLLTTGLARHHGHRQKQELYPLNIDLIDGWFRSELSFKVPKTVARYAKNLMDCLPNANAMASLEDMKDLHLTVRTSEAWENILDELERRASQLGPGAIKHEVYNIDTEKLANDIKKLVDLKKQKEEKNKDLNPDEN